MIVWNRNKQIAEWSVDTTKKLDNWWTKHLGQSNEYPNKQCGLLNLKGKVN